MVLQPKIICNKYTKNGKVQLLLVFVLYFGLLDVGCVDLISILRDIGEVLLSSKQHT